MHAKNVRFQGQLDYAWTLLRDTDQRRAFSWSITTNVNVLMDGGLENVIVHYTFYTPAFSQFRGSALTCITCIK